MWQVDRSGVPRRAAPAITRVLASAFSHACLFALLISTACDDPAAVSWPVAVASVDITPTIAQLQPGDEVKLSAIPRDAGGGQLAAGTATWVSSDDRVARVSIDGWVTGVAPGAVTIRAIRDNVPGEARVVVAWTPVTRIDIVPSRIDIPWFGRERMTAILYDSRGNKLRARPMVWTSSPSWVANIDNDGNMIAIAEGYGTITAHVDQALGTASFTVVNPCSSGRLTPAYPVFLLGYTYRMQVAFMDRSSNVIAPPMLSWATSNAEVAEVGQDGWVYPRAVGYTTITASCGRTTASTSVRVSR